MRLALIEDYNRQAASGKAFFTNGGLAFEPSSLQSSLCYTSGFETYFFSKAEDRGTSGIGTTAHYCPQEHRYWLNQYGGQNSQNYNRWAGPFEYKRSLKYSDA